MANRVINQINDATVFQSTVALNQGTEWSDIYGKPNGLTQENINAWISLVSEVEALRLQVNALQNR